MAKLDKKFKMTGRKMKDFSSPIPPGEYLAEITGSELKETKAKDGHYVNMEFTITKGEYKGRKVWKILNLYHNDQTTVQIAEEELESICAAVGFAEGEVISDTEKLHNKPLKIMVRIQKSAGYDDKNTTSGYSQAGGKKVSKPDWEAEEDDEEIVEKEKKSKKEKKGKKKKDKDTPF